MKIYAFKTNSDNSFMRFKYGYLFLRLKYRTMWSHIIQSAIKSLKGTLIFYVLEVTK